MEAITLDMLAPEYTPLKIQAWSDTQLLRILLVEQYSLDQALYHDIEARIHNIRVSDNVKHNYTVSSLDREYYFAYWNVYHNPKKINPYRTFDRNRYLAEDYIAVNTA